jgi:integrase
VSVSLAAATVVLVDPRPGDLVFPAHRVRPGIREDLLPHFGHWRWDLALLSHDATTRSKAFLWSNFPGSLRDSFMRISWAVINIPTPDILHNHLTSSTRPVLAMGSLMQTLTAFRAFAIWLEKHQVDSLDQVDQDLLEQYATSLGARGFTDPQDERRLFAISRIWAYAPFLLPQDRLVMPPWEDPGAAITDFLDDFQRHSGENRTVVVHPATMSPTLVWALRMVVDFAPDITAAYREWQRLDNRIVAPGSALPDGPQKVRDHLRHLRDSGGKLPTYVGHLDKAIIGRWHQGGDGPPPINNSYLAGLLGVTREQVLRTLRRWPQDTDSLAMGSGAPLPTPVTGTVDGKPWISAIDFNEAVALTLHLTTAALITIGYLSGMRPEEVLHLERGCSSPHEREDGTVRYLVTGRHFKGVTDKDGNSIPEGEIRPDPWTVIELVDRAVKVLQDLHEERLLFPRVLSSAFRDTDDLGEALSPVAAVKRFQTFAAWANQCADRLGRHHEMIPDDPNGPVTLRRLRRTVAWFIYRQPGGRIALGLQYGHVGTSMAESYGGRTNADMLQMLDFEQTLAMADSLARASDRIDAGEQISGPAADRYVASAREFSTRFEGGFASKSQMKALKSNPRLHVYDDPQALLACNLDPFKALCDPELARGGSPIRTPNRTRCNPACANISRTDTHMRRAQEQIDEIDEELEDTLLPWPMRRRLQLRRASREQLIQNHQTTGRTAPPASGKT